MFRHDPKRHLTPSDNSVGLAVGVADGGVGEEAAGGDGDGGEFVRVLVGRDEACRVLGRQSTAGRVEEVAGGL